MVFASQSPSCLFAFLLFCIAFSPSADSSQFELVGDWSKSLVVELTRQLDAVSRFQEIDNSYGANDAKFVVHESVESLSLVTETREAVQELLKRRRNQLQAVVAQAKSLATDHSFADDVPDVNLDQLDAKMSVAFKDAQIEPNLKRPSINRSVIHTPVDVWEHSQEVLHVVNWTIGLDDVWRRNVIEDSSVGWQYFGSTSGVLRFFPGSRWPDPDVIDTFDIRRRPPFTVGSSLPKNMLILVDTSGSVKGQTLELLIFAVKSLIDTLDDNDFLQVARFPTSSDEGATFHIVDCFPQFVQATAPNKKKFVHALDDLSPEGMANFQEVFEYAFDLYDHFDNGTSASADLGYQSAKCNRVIMVLTDAVTDYPDELFLKKNRDNYVKIFTYAMGLTARETALMKLMACENGGDFAYIPAMGAVRSKTQQYFDTLSQPLGDKHKNSLRWTAAYPHAVTGLQTISATLPVFRDDSEGKLSFQGVAGVDVAIRELTALFPVAVWGPIGLAFIINRNGHAIYFGDLPGDANEYLQSMPEVDFMDLWPRENTKADEDLIKALRKNLIQNVQNNVGSTVDYNLCQRRSSYVQCFNRDFFSTQIGDPETPYVLGFALPVGTNLEKKVVSQFDVSNKASEVKCDLTELITPCPVFPQCQNVTGIVDVCDADRKRLTVLDALSSSLADNSWSENNSVADFMFVRGVAGVQRIFPKGRKIVLTEEVLKLTITRPSAWTFTPSSGSVVALRPLSIQSGSVPAIVGVGIESSFLEQIIHDQLRSVDTDCKEKDLTMCFLLDEGGFVVYSNQAPADVGKFYGDTDAVLMQSLIAQNVFRGLVQYDFRAQCKVETKYFSDAPSSLRIPWLKFFDLLSLPWWMAKASALWAPVNIVSWTTSLFASSTFWASESFATVTDDPPEFVPCVKNMTFYTFGSAVEEQQLFTGDVSTCTCTRSYGASRLKDTNLLLIVSQSDSCHSECPVRKVPRLPIQDNVDRRSVCREETRVVDGVTRKVNVPLNKLFRLRPYDGECSVDGVRPVTTECSAASRIDVTWRIGLFSLIGSVVFLTSATLNF